MIEFDCCECGRHIIDIVGEKLLEPPLCAHCLHIPGWTLDPVLCRIFDPSRPWPWPVSA